MRLSVLDQAPVTSGHTGVDGVQNAVELAQTAESLGYHRMWLAEHHNTDQYASAAPEVIASHILGKTEKIRVGTGGIMLMHYSPLKIAEVIKTLSALGPDRVDFGAGRAPGGDMASIRALADERKPHYDNQYEKFRNTLEFLKDNDPEHENYKNIIASPTEVSLPQPYLLGSSGSSALEAARMGVGYSFAQFFMSNSMREEIFEHYRKAFRPSEFSKKPYTIVSYMVTVAESKEEAEYQALPYDIYRIRLAQGRAQKMMTPEEASRIELNKSAKQTISNNRKRAGTHYVGTAKEVSSRLLAEQERYGFDEAMIVTIPHSQEQRLNVYRLLAEELLS